MSLRESLHRSWQRPSLLTVLLLPLSAIYWSLFRLNSLLYQLGIRSSWQAPMPVIVVGNLTVGGSGKTPLVIELVRQLQAAGFTPGVISRGYHSSVDHYPCLVSADSDARLYGDESVLIARRTGVPVMIGADRRASVEALLANHPVDILVSDDGLQHFALQRDVEICIHDFTRSDDNRWVLPAGPYREPAGRMASTDLRCGHVTEFVPVTGPDTDFQMRLQASAPVALKSDNAARFDPSRGVHAIAGIGNPERFFRTCEALGWSIQRHVFADHYQYQADDLMFADELPVVMTEKDAVKCFAFAGVRHWYLPVDVELQGELGGAVVNLLNRKSPG